MGVFGSAESIRPTHPTTPTQTTARAAVDEPAEGALEHFPAFLALAGRPVLVVGGGEVATRKVRLLVRTGAHLTVVAKRVLPEIRERAEHGGLRLIQRGFVSGDVSGKRLVVAATDDAEVNRRVAEAAEHAGVPVNVVDDAALSSFIFPAIVDRGEVVVAISSGGASPVLARQLRARIEQLLPLRLGALAAFARRLRSRIRARVPQALPRLRIWETALTGAVADAVLAGHENEAEALLDHLVAGERPQGSVAIVGAGPGDPELLTLKALRLIQTADVIVHDKLVAPATLGFARRDAELIYVGKSRGNHTLPQSEINALLAHHARRGRRVVRLKGGDPFIFGRGGEELEYLHRLGLPTEVVPGVTAASACAAASGVPLTHRGLAQAAVLVTAQGSAGEPDIDWQALARLHQTIAVYMGVGAAARIERELIANGLAPATPVAIVENATLSSQRVLSGSLGSLSALVEDNGVKGPAVILIGEVAGLPLAVSSPASCAALAG